MKKDIFFRNGSIKYLSECDMDVFKIWVCATFGFPFGFSFHLNPSRSGKSYRTAVLSELQKRVEILK